MNARPRGLLRFTTAAGCASALLLLTAAPALALDPGANSSAYGIKASALANLINVPATPKSTFPAGSTEHLVSVNLGALGTVGAANATTAGDSSAGTSSATGSVADVALLGLGVPAISADLISATCSAAAPDAPTGSSTLAAASLGTAGVLTVNPAPNTQLLNLGALLKVTLNEQTLNNGVLTVNALHVRVLGATGVNLIIGQAVCGPNTAAPAVASFSFQKLPIILGGIAILALLAYGAQVGIRRVRSTA